MHTDAGHGDTGFDANHSNRGHQHPAVAHLSNDYGEATTIVLGRRLLLDDFDRKGYEWRLPEFAQRSAMRLRL
jgi:hypothetical protein